jgi:hypothetical protein
MKLINTAFGVSFVAAAVMVACASEQGGTPATGSHVGSTAPPYVSGSVGSVGINLLTPAGTSIASIAWTISNGTNTYTGTVDLGDASILGSIEFAVGGIAAGTGYTLTLVGADSNGDPCSGASGAFTVVANTDNYVGVNVVCTVPTDAATGVETGTGSVEVDAGVAVVQQGPYQCPAIQSFSITPALLETSPLNPSLPGFTSQLAATQAGGTPGTITWAVNASTTQVAVTATPGMPGYATIKCFAAGTYTLTAKVALNVIPLEQDASVNVCLGQPFTTMTGMLNCVKPGG